MAAKLDLVLLKLYAGGPQDLWDIKQLLNSEENMALENQVTEALEQLPVSFGETWTRVLSD